LGEIKDTEKLENKSVDTKSKVLPHFGQVHEKPNIHSYEDNEKNSQEKMA
jgi:hypothetical protein